MKTRDCASGKAVVLLSGGLDSTAAIALAPEAGFEPVAALFFDYGQHAARKEERAARGIAGFYRISFERIELPWMARFSKSALVAGAGEPPRWSPDRLEDAAPRAVWVENRNGIFINVAAFYAAEQGMDAVVAGFNREEAAAFPDNGGEFIDRINRALELSIGRSVRVVAPTLAMMKREIVERSLALDFPWELLWSCYRGGDLPCGSCESCLRLRRAVAGTGAEGRVRFEKEDV
ncbi:MAG: 7-cyano-7-deazaguanine synthase QueC [Candidatus Krumholzibacteria bacterium]|nr:7-cyano-7-deazaguanine synthase QueC [Candidatus Krumholzibacteria bacterium]